MDITCINSDYYEVTNLDCRNLHASQYVVFDVEATGIDWREERVTQIGAVRVGGPLTEIREEFSTYVNPMRVIPPRIQNLTGISQSAVTKAPTFREAILEFGEFCADYPLVTQAGYEFDIPLLREECRRTKCGELGGTVLDTKVIYRALHPEVQKIPSTDFLCEVYQIDRSQFQRHDALGDARLTARMLMALLAEAKALGVEDIVVCKPLRVPRSKTPAIPDVEYCLK